MKLDNNILQLVIKIDSNGSAALKRGKWGSFGIIELNKDRCLARSVRPVAHRGLEIETLGFTVKSFLGI